MYVKNGIQNIFILRTLYGKGADPRGECSTNLRLEQHMVKLFKKDLRLENVWKNDWGEVGQVGKSLDLGLTKKEDLSGNISQTCPLASNKS